MYGAVGGGKIAADQDFTRRYKEAESLNKALSTKNWYVMHKGLDAYLDTVPDVEIITHESEWTPEKADGFFGSCSILVEAFDQAGVKAAFVNWASAHASSVVSGNGMASPIGAGTPPLPRSARHGAASAGTIPGEATMVKKLGNIYMVGDRTTSITDGNPPLAPRVIQCAAKMAEIVLDLTLNIPPLR